MTEHTFYTHGEMVLSIPLTPETTIPAIHIDLQTAEQCRAVYWARKNKIVQQSQSYGPAFYQQATLLTYSKHSKQLKKMPELDSIGSKSFSS